MKPAASPLVSVVMPVHDALPYLDEAIESVAGQTYGHLEIVTVDDGSTDGSSETLARLQAADSRARVIEQPHAGFVVALKHACDVARGTYLARLDADDVAFPDRIERQVDYLEGHPDIALVGGGAVFVDTNGKEFATVGYPTRREELVAALETSCPFVHSAVMMRANAYRSVGGYRTVFPRAEDYDLWLRLAERFSVANLDVPVVRYRIHTRQTTLATVDDQARWFLIAQAAHRARVAGRRDLLDDAEARSWSQLFDDYGIDAETFTSARIDGRVWHAKTLTRAGARAAARAVWTEAEELAGQLRDDGRRRDDIAAVRRAVEGERRRRRVRGLVPRRRRTT